MCRCYNQYNNDNAQIGGLYGTSKFISIPVYPPDYELHDDMQNFFVQAGAEAGQRSDFGAYQNRLEHAININQNVEENTQAAEALIRDTDMADMMMEFSVNNILMLIKAQAIELAPAYFFSFLSAVLHDPNDNYPYK